MDLARYLVAAVLIAALGACGNPEIDKRLLDLSQSQTKVERQVLELTATHAELTRQIGELNKEVAALKAEDDEDDDDEEDEAPKAKPAAKPR